MHTEGTSIELSENEQLHLKKLKPYLTLFKDPLEEESTYIHLLLAKRGGYDLSDLYLTSAEYEYFRDHLIGKTIAYKLDDDLKIIEAFGVSYRLSPEIYTLVKSLYNLCVSKPGIYFKKSQIYESIDKDPPDRGFGSFFNSKSNKGNDNSRLYANLVITRPNSKSSYRLKGV